MAQRIKEQIGTFAAIKPEGHFFQVGGEVFRADLVLPDKNKIMLPEERPLVQIVHWRVTPKVAALIKATMVAPAIAVAGWLVQNFLQLRGVVNLTASRVDLAFIVLALFVAGFALTIGWRHKRIWRLAIFVF